MNTLYKNSYTWVYQTFQYDFDFVNVQAQVSSFVDLWDKFIWKAITYSIWTINLKYYIVLTANVGQAILELSPYYSFVILDTTARIGVLVAQYASCISM